MLDRRTITENPDLIRQSLEKRRSGDDVLAAFDRLRQVIERRREVQTETDKLRSERNTLSKQIGALMKDGRRDEAEEIKARVKAQAEALGNLEEEWKSLEAEEDTLLLELPNTLDERVPDGAGEADNKLVRTWGEPRQLDFEPKPHDELAEALGLYDADRAAKLSGARFSLLYGDLARLERALANFFLDRAAERGYREVAVPHIVGRTAMTGTGQLPKFEQDMFKVSGDFGGEDGFLIPTSEVPVTNIHRDEIVDPEQLPLKFCCWSACFRAEAGSYGKDTRGLIRQHQFWKVELVKVCAPDSSPAEHEGLTADAEALLQALNLPYRVMLLSSGDIGFGARLCYDIEVWLPGQGAYREISSCSSYGDFQARRMKLRTRPAEGGKPVLCHTINGSALAIGRTLVAILENYQQADGTVEIPEVLRPYMGGLDRLRAGQ